MSEVWKQWEGQVIDSRFPLRQLLGESSHSAVFATERLDRGGAKAAIKLVAAGGAAAEAQLGRWRQVARLSHPNILPLYHYGRCRLGDQELLFAVMEFADETLAEILPQRALSAAETRQMLETVTGALAYLHQQGLVHGDIQPANILAVGETIKLSSDTLRPIHDASSAAHGSGAADSRSTASGSGEPAGDIYSLGIMLVQALTQHSPFDAGVSLGHAAEPLPAPFDDIVLHALHPDPQLRWTAGDIAARLKPEAMKVARSAAAGTATAGPASSAGAATAGGAAVRMPKAKQPAAKEAAQAPAKTARAASVAPTAVPLSPVAPLRRAVGAGGPSSSLLRYAGVIAAVAVLLFLATRVFHRGTDSPATIASSSPESAHVPQAVESKATPAPKPAATPAREFSKEAPRTGTANAPQQAVPKAAVASALTTNSGQTAAKAKAEVAPVTEASPAALRSEVRARPAASADREILRQVMPDISQKALSTIRGTVRLAIRVQVDRAGKVSDAEFDSPSGSAFFNDLAMKAARQWQFQPADSQTEPGRSYLLRFEFTQEGASASGSRSR